MSQSVSQSVSSSSPEEDSPEEVKEEMGQPIPMSPWEYQTLQTLAFSSSGCYSAA